MSKKNTTFGKLNWSVMRISFQIDYSTNWGESIFVKTNIKSAQKIDLSCKDGRTWFAEIDIKEKLPTVLKYNYFHVSSNGESAADLAFSRELKTKGNKNFRLIDAWPAKGEYDDIFSTAPFEKIIFPSDYNAEEIPEDKNFTHHFIVRAPFLKAHQTVCILGEGVRLGHWTAAAAVIMSAEKYPYYTASLNLADLQNGVKYKYGIYDFQQHTFVEYENGLDRIVPSAQEGEVVVVNDNIARFDVHWRGAGVNIPLFSIRTNHSFGCGDFSDLPLFAEWAHKVGFKLIQLLPVNDTIGTNTDYDILPYSAVSAFALNPLFLDLESLPMDKRNPIYKEYISLKEEFNRQAQVAYLPIVQFKMRYLEQSFKKHGATILASEAFKAFYEKNEFWLKPYGVYRYMAKKYGHNKHSLWKGNTKYRAAKYRALCDPSNEAYSTIALWWYCQYYLSEQFKAAIEKAHALGVVIKGDIPIGVNPNSVDTWVNPELFNLNVSAGAPPDMFAKKGQNWALPTYNWEQMERTQYKWWRCRLEQMSHYFDAFRIDHILGFFRIWQIPNEQVEGIMGYLYPSVPLYYDEFERMGVHFDLDRYTKPFITRDILYTIFGDRADSVMEKYLHYQGDRICLNDGCCQLSVEQDFQNGVIDEQLRNGLFDLISNILLFKVQNTEQWCFYPRIDAKETLSYSYLSGHEKYVFDQLYVDYFYRRQDAAWYNLGMEKLSQIKSSSPMLICGEDLGMMTECVTKTMHNLHILSLEIQRAPKSDKIEFFHPADAPYLSVITPSTHDMSTIRGWWEEDREVTQRFYNTQMGLNGYAPYFCEDWVARRILDMHFYSPAMWAIFQWQDIMSIDARLRRENPNEERVNVPSNSAQSWRYRMHITVEELLKEDAFNSAIKQLIHDSGR